MPSLRVGVAAQPPQLLGQVWRDALPTGARAPGWRSATRRLPGSRRPPKASLGPTGFPRGTGRTAKRLPDLEPVMDTHCRSKLNSQDVSRNPTLLRGVLTDFCLQVRADISQAQFRFTQVSERDSPSLLADLRPLRHPVCAKLRHRIAVKT